MNKHTPANNPLDGDHAVDYVESSNTIAISLEISKITPMPDTVGPQAMVDWLEPRVEKMTAQCGAVGGLFIAVGMDMHSVFARGEITDGGGDTDAAAEARPPPSGNAKFDCSVGDDSRHCVSSSGAQHTDESGLV